MHFHVRVCVILRPNVAKGFNKNPQQKNNKINYEILLQF